MKKVNKEEFYDFVMPKDLILDVRSENGACLYKKRHTGEVMGKSIESSDFVEAAIGEGTTYFITQS